MTDEELKAKIKEVLAECKFIAEDWPAIGQAIENQDFQAFEPAFHKAIDQANAYHDLKHRPFIRCKLPDFPPLGLDLAARRKK